MFPAPHVCMGDKNYTQKTTTHTTGHTLLLDATRTRVPAVHASTHSTQLIRSNKRCPPTRGRYTHLASLSPIVLLMPRKRPRLRKIGSHSLCHVWRPARSPPAFFIKAAAYRGQTTRLSVCAPSMIPPRVTRKTSMIDATPPAAHSTHIHLQYAPHCMAQTPLVSLCVLPRRTLTYTHP